MYFFVFGAGVSYMLKLIARGPETGAHEDTPGEREPQNRRPARPLSAAPDDVERTGGH
jgi:cytochrome d ubiquinol oxidase subunit I